MKKIDKSKCLNNKLINCNKDIINEYIKIYYLSTGTINTKPLRFIINKTKQQVFY